MHILFAAPGYKPAYRIGGPILSVSAAAETLVKKGHKVTVFTSNCNVDEDLDVPDSCPVDILGVEVWYFKRQEPLKKWLPFVPYLSQSIGLLYTPQMWLELDRLVPQVDIVHTHMPFVYPTYAAARAAFKYRKPLFYHQRGGFDPEHLKFRSIKKKLFLSLVEKRTLRRATTLISLTDFETKSYRLLGIKTPCVTIPNGIAVEDYWQDLPSAWHDKLGIDRQATVVLFLGRLHPTKGVERLLEAFLQVYKLVPRAVLVMAGPDEFGLQERMRERVGNAGVKGRVLFPGMVSGDTKRALLCRADLFCLPSNAEGFSIAILEALASRTAVLISAGCHFPEVEHVGAGKVCSLKPDDIATTMTGLLSHRDKLVEMGRKGFEFVSHNYSWDHITDELISAYERGIQQHRK